jgi:hypothetical protein
MIKKSSQSFLTEKPQCLINLSTNYYFYKVQTYILVCGKTNRQQHAPQRYHLVLQPWQKKTSKPKFCSILKYYFKASSIRVHREFYRPMIYTLFFYQWSFMRCLRRYQNSWYSTLFNVPYHQFNITFSVYQIKYNVTLVSNDTQNSKIYMSCINITWHYINYFLVM